MKLLSIANDAKTRKSIAHGWLTAVMFLEPGDHDICPWAVDACRAVCLSKAGRNAGPAPRAARELRTLLWRNRRRAFLDLLAIELNAFVKRAARKHLAPCARLNGTSDLDWRWVVQAWPEIQFYDYTKSPSRMRAWLRRLLPANYHLTFSWSGQNADVCVEVLESGGTVALPRDKDAPLPTMLTRFPTLDGDTHDMRWTDPCGHLVLLKPKGLASRGPAAQYARDEHFIIGDHVP